MKTGVAKNRLNIFSSHEKYAERMDAETPEIEDFSIILLNPNFKTYYNHTYGYEESRERRNEKTKSKVIAAMMITLFSASMTTIAVPVSAAPTEFTLTCHMVFSEWDAGGSFASPFGDWSRSYPPGIFSFVTMFTVTKNVLRYAWAPTVFVNDKKSGFWVEHGGPYSFTEWGLEIVGYSRGYFSFSGTPSNATFQHGVEYGWGFVYGVDEATVKASCPYTVWDETMGAWLVYFNVILYDSTPTAYTLPFPSPFMEPVPASDYNPLGL